MFGRVSRRLFSASLLALLTGCSSLGIGGNSEKQPGADITVAPQAGAPAAASTPTPTYVAGKCPQAVIRDEDAVYRTYAKGAKDDASQLVYQASLAQATRQCTSDGTSLGIHVVAQGRLVAGPMGSSGKVTLPIHVAVMDNDNALYSKTIMYTAEIPPGETTAQFLFTDDDIQVAGGSGGFTIVQIGFDQGPQKPAKSTKPVRRKHQ
ncbi:MULTISPECIES: hypothetical protein [unclassified Rhizobium]|uniref:hypothetical protein n=1 Tax=unclassified Rhizobium TaxID=2613769 RepID=UPI0006487371|nr:MULTISPECIES: hypothetical protein [unclassified Rhizobium]MBN8950461.1 hypothetical protein [Rhizobium tropici]OJY68983.1 MAG: hypothetical protein BGP09_09960 [Rhizobium sp. 60-20]RKD74240.1 hypothetical protein BJ928_101591 [Rhizobium sp. WW_1]